jgi:hypothetical protein
MAMGRRRQWPQVGSFCAGARAWCAVVRGAWEAGRSWHSCGGFVWKFGTVEEGGRGWERTGEWENRRNGDGGASAKARSANGRQEILGCALRIMCSSVRLARCCALVSILAQRYLWGRAKGLGTRRLWIREFLIFLLEGGARNDQFGAARKDDAGDEDVLCFTSGADGKFIL